MLWRRLTLRGKLFVSSLLSAVVTLGVLLLAAHLVAPDFIRMAFAGPPRPPGMPLGRAVLQSLCPPGGGGSAWPASSWDAGWPPGCPMPPPSSIAGLLHGLLRAGLETLAVSAALALLVSLGASALLAWQVLGPLRRLLAASVRLAAGDYAQRVAVAPSNRGDEIGALGRGFNAMALALERNERRRMDLIGDVAHELRTPLASLQGYLEGLQDGVVPPGADTWRRLLGETGRLRRLVEDLHELSRAEARQIGLELADLPVSEVVDAALQPLQAAFRAKGLELSAELPAQLPRMRADRERTIQVLQNLLTNALRYTPGPGRVTVSAAALPAAVRITVQDTGIGLAPQDVAAVFDRFFRVERSRSRASGGSGVGLTIARALAEAMDGTLEAESAGPGRGTSFHLTLPAVR